ncbi:3-deoxy-manno-octulosonate cytidylyltransferase (CMP-KDO synthetase) [Parvibaculum indicum]|uniref:3-deoxy-manno-octulosonate cytidylyltransferase n=1 Tax=Parvibaculum indicum TaxID=562969 RepID=UPI001420434D|nr:3-deoxy-manno-octulosonate cytidylyltransferase [Parvibaculum indicum]NIJ40790.1 3-deoxy-manno-octulosonate cytidylyltransferase (CMP-KDO synthetase) [Parvibaculum indicum]
MTGPQSTAGKSTAGAHAGNPLIVIPARMASSRLPGKPLEDIGGAPMIVQVLRRAEEAELGRVVVAAAEKEIADAVTASGGEAVLTDPDLPSGSDRIWQAVNELDPQGRHSIVINVQGDLPTLDPALIRVAYEALIRPGADISTLAAVITDPQERENPNVVKAVAAFPEVAKGETPFARALYFTRATAPWGEGPLYHHIGLYGYRREALSRFVGMPPSQLEQREKLEQLRALEAGMSIEVALVDTVPLGVDTPADLEKARNALGSS